MTKKAEFDIVLWGGSSFVGKLTPWGPSLAMIGFALLALLIDAPWSPRVLDT